MTTPTTGSASNRLTTDPSILNSEAEPERPPLSTRVLARRVDEVPRSGIRRFFDIMATMTDVISLGVGEPDFDTPRVIVRHSLAARRTHYASNYGTIELRRALAHHLERLYGVRYDPTEEILITIGASQTLRSFRYCWFVLSGLHCMKRRLSGSPPPGMPISSP